MGWISGEYGVDFWWKWMGWISGGNGVDFWWIWGGFLVEMEWISGGNGVDFWWKWRRGKEVVKTTWIPFAKSTCSPRKFNVAPWRGFHMVSTSFACWVVALWQLRSFTSTEAMPAPCFASGDDHSPSVSLIQYVARLLCRVLSYRFQSHDTTHRVYDRLASSLRITLQYSFTKATWNGGEVRVIMTIYKLQSCYHDSAACI